MGAPDSQGIYQYDDTEDFAPLQDYLNLGMESVSATVADIRAEISDLELLVDSDWVHITEFSTGWTGTAGHPPRVRKVGDRVDLFGAVTIAAEASGSTILMLPEGYIPAGAYTNQFIGSGVSSDGVGYTLYTSSSTPRVLEIRPGYSTGSFGVGAAVPLLGSWYVS